MSMAIGFILGFVTCLGLLYWLGVRRHGSNSRENIEENIVVKVGRD